MVCTTYSSWCYYAVYFSQLQGYVLLSSTRLYFFCHELRVYYQLPVVGCVSLTSLTIACAWPFGWSCALKTIAPIFSVTIIFIILPILLWFVSIQFIFQSTNTIVENENCLCFTKNSHRQRCACTTNLNNPLFRIQI